MEEWKDIPGYEGLYQASNLGRLRSLPRLSRRRMGTEIRQYMTTGKILEFSPNKKGYLYTALLKDGKLKSYVVHRLIAYTFIPNPLGLPQINHKNENKGDNRVENLEWCTNLYNRNYGTNKDNFKKPVIAIDKNMQRAEFDSMSSAERITGISKSSISACCRGERKSVGGYKWELLK